MNNGMQECPVCTLYLRPGISLKHHLDTHPKDQVIDALLRAKDGGTQASTDAVVALSAPLPASSSIQTTPQMTTAFTYQQILTTNAAGAVVPQFLQVPALVNSPFTISQNMGFAPTLFNPIYNPYVPQPYPFNNSSASSTTTTTTATASSLNNEGETTAINEEVGSEMDLSDGSPQCPSATNSPSPPSSAPSVIIARTRRSQSTPPPPSFPPIQSPDCLSLPASPGGSSFCSSPTPLCKVEDSVIVEPSTSQSSVARSRDCFKMEMSELDRRDQDSSHLTYNSLDSNRDESSVQEHEVVANLSRVPIDITGDPSGSCISETDLKKVENDSLCQTTPEMSKTELVIDLKNSDEGLRFSYLDDAANLVETDAVYTDLLPPSSPRLLHDLLPAPSTSNAFMELDGIRIFFNGAGAHPGASRGPSPPSVIQLADSTKMDLSPLPLNIAADESMPARGELSEQESLGVDSAWGLFQQDVKIDSWQPEHKDFKCSACSLIFSCPKERRAHKLQVHMKPGKTFKCSVCSAAFSTLRDRRSHMVIHAAVVKTLKVESGVLAPPTEVSSSAKHCPTCATSFPSLRDLRVHLREIHGEVRYKCEECQTCFDEETDFNLHLKTHPLKCPECGKLFYRRANLSLHLKRHLPVKPFECALCPKSFITRQKLEEHTNGHTGVRPIKCVQCDRTFSRHSNLIQHRNMHHLKTKRKIRDFVCRCGEVFHSQRKLEWHREIHDNKPKSCPYCAQKFIHAASVTRHVRRSHLPEYLPDPAGREYENVSCPICDRVYLRSSLSVHMRVHNGERPFQCTICTKHFTTKWNMELHQWTHQSRSSMPYKCTQCKSAFFREADHLAHLNAHKNLKPFICNVCGQKFIRKYNCLRHQEEHRRAKRFTCTVAGCNRAFHRSYYLKDHMKVHTGVRPHTCHICGKASSTKSNHNKHVRIHDTRELVNTEN